MNEKEALALIEEMIGKAKTNISDNGVFYLLWGYMVFFSACIHFLLEVYPQPFVPPYAVWPICMSIAGIASYFITQKREKQKQVKTYMEDFINNFWIAFGISLLLSLIIALNTYPLLAYPIILILYGLGTFVTGKVLKFNPLIWGGVICWILAVISAFVSFNLQLLLLASGVLFSYIIPGHILKIRYQKSV